MRLFAAVRPPSHVLAHLAVALDGLLGPQRREGVRWTAAENWHFTLAFYGEVPDGAVGEVQDGLARVSAATEPFSLRLRGAGVFAHRTLWVGAAGDVATMAGLAAGAVAVGTEVTGRVDERPRHRPHLTVGRVVTERGGRRRRAGPSAAGVEAIVHAMSVYDGPEWEVEEVLLVSSRPGAGRGGGPLYEDVAGFRLGSAGGAVAP